MRRMATVRFGRIIHPDADTRLTKLKKNGPVHGVRRGRQPKSNGLATGPILEATPRNYSSECDVNHTETPALVSG